jgi:hypothetical protein
MRAPLRSLLLLVAAVFAAGTLGACGNKQDKITRAESEGMYLDLGDLKYQVQISRQLNPADSEDEAYLVGVRPQDRQLAKDETWYGIFLRVQNTTDDPHQAAEEFEIRDTRGNVLRPLELAPENVFAYRAARVPPKQLIPGLDSPAASNTIQGSLLLFKVPYANLQNRPLEFEIADPANPSAKASVALDV